MSVYHDAPRFQLDRPQSAARRCPLLVTVCAQLTLWNGFGSQVLLPAAAGSLPLASQIPSPSQEDGDDDDYVLDLTGKPEFGRHLPRHRRLPSPGLRPPIAVPNPCLCLTCKLAHLPPAPVCEHEYR